MRIPTILLTLLVSGLTLPGAWSGDAPVTSVKVQMLCIKIGLDAFQADCGRYPSTVEGLAALEMPPKAIPEGRWHGPYTDTVPLKDRWKHDFVYTYPGTHNTNGFDLYSKGPDGVSKSGGEDLDDINNWGASSPHRGVVSSIRSGTFPRWFISGAGVLVLLFVFIWRIRQASTPKARNEVA